MKADVYNRLLRQSQCPNFSGKQKISRFTWSKTGTETSSLNGQKCLLLAFVLAEIKALIGLLIQNDVLFFYQDESFSLHIQITLKSK
jgi:hypothetical protein